MTAGSSSKYPARCVHDVILCDVCAHPQIHPPQPSLVARERALEMARADTERLARENDTLRDRNRDLERSLADLGDIHYDLKQQILHLQTLNEELRASTTGRRRV